MKQRNRTWIRLSRIFPLTAVMLIGVGVPNSGSVQEPPDPCPDGRAIARHVITINTQANIVAPKKQDVCRGDIVEWNITPRPPTVDFFLWFPGENPMETGGGVSGNGKLVDVVRGDAPRGKEYEYGVILKTKLKLADPHIIVE